MQFCYLFKFFSSKISFLFINIINIIVLIAKVYRLSSQNCKYQSKIELNKHVVGDLPGLPDISVACPRIVYIFA